MAVVTNYQGNEMRQVGWGGIPEWMIPSGFNLVDGWDDLTGLWKVWAGTYNVATDTLGLFINGVDQGTSVDSGALAVSDIYLGSRTDTYHWIGNIAEVLVFDDVLINETASVRRLHILQEQILVSGNVVLNFGSFGSKRITLTSDTTFSAVGTATVRASNCASSATRLRATWSGPRGSLWASAAPASIAANKTALLQLWAFGLAESDIVARYLVEP